MSYKCWAHECMRVVEEALEKRTQRMWCTPAPGFQVSEELAATAELHNKVNTLLILKGGQELDYKRKVHQPQHISLCSQMLSLQPRELLSIKQLLYFEADSRFAVHLMRHAFQSATCRALARQ